MVVAGGGVFQRDIVLCADMPPTLSPNQELPHICSAVTPGRPPSLPSTEQLRMTATPHQSSQDVCEYFYEGISLPLGSFTEAPGTGKGNVLMLGPGLSCILEKCHFSCRNAECLPVKHNFLKCHILKDIVFHLFTPAVYPNKGNGLLPRKA